MEAHFENEVHIPQSHRYLLTMQKYTWVTTVGINPLTFLRDQGVFEKRCRRWIILCWNFQNQQLGEVIPIYMASWWPSDDGNDEKDHLEE